ncbi:hypothetical protein NDU88_000712 [Pleurodeles waltl]|uniref:Uncharacterized protein n=1 Tax=Pleurodeles waltl TaxID=8319 RepID=A0AAV7U8C4_PLEWA|nr:hypothetical protein NDU88_000712 [Pleurodeles waltl]
MRWGCALGSQGGPLYPQRLTARASARVPLSAPGDGPEMRHYSPGRREKIIIKQEPGVNKVLNWCEAGNCKRRRACAYSGTEGPWALQLRAEGFDPEAQVQSELSAWKGTLPELTIWKETTLGQRREAGA